MLCRLAARVYVRFALPPSSFLFQQRDHTISEACSSANILQGLSKLLANSLNSYLAYIMCYDFSLFLNQKGFESNINHSLLIEGSNSSDYGQRHRDVWVMRVPEKPRHVMAIQDVGMRLRGSTWAVNPWVGSWPTLVKLTRAVLVFRNQAFHARNEQWHASKNILSFPLLQAANEKTSISQCALCLWCCNVLYIYLHITRFLSWFDGVSGLIVLGRDLLAQSRIWTLQFRV